MRRPKALSLIGWLTSAEAKDIRGSIKIVPFQLYIARWWFCLGKSQSTA